VKKKDQLIRVKVYGPGNGVVADMIAKSLRDNGLKVCHWNDVDSGEGDTATKNAHDTNSSVLVLEMVAAK